MRKGTEDKSRKLTEAESKELTASKLRGAELVDIRKSLNLTQDQLGFLLGVQQRIISSTERGHLVSRSMSISVLEKARQLPKDEKTINELLQQKPVVITPTTYWDWLNVRERWASVSVDFERGGTYKQHRVTWHVADFGWISATGQSLEEAVANAMVTRVNHETGEHFTPTK